MYKVTVTAGSARSLGIKAMNFETKESAVVFITTQLNKILNNSHTTTWNISMQDLPGTKRA